MTFKIAFTIIFFLIAIFLFIYRIINKQNINYYLLNIKEGETEIKDRDMFIYLKNNIVLILSLMSVSFGLVTYGLYENADIFIPCSLVFVFISHICCRVLLKKYIIENKQDN